MRITGTKRPLHIRDHAVIFNGLQTHSSGKLNGDRWSLVLCVHASWASVSKETEAELLQLGLPCPPKGYNGYNVALPAADDLVSTPAKAGSSRDAPIDADEPVVEEAAPTRATSIDGSAEEANTVEHHTDSLTQELTLRGLLQGQGTAQTKTQNGCRDRTRRGITENIYEVRRLRHGGSLDQERRRGRG